MFKANRVAGRRAGGRSVRPSVPAGGLAAGGRAVEDSLHDVRARLEDKFAIASMAKKLLHCCIGAHTHVHMHFCGESACNHRCC